MIFTTRIPTHFNDGSPVAQSLMNSILVDIHTTFGGYTLEGPAQGAWVDDDGNVYQETSFRLEVACQRGRYLECRDKVIEIGRQLKQKAMYFEVRYVDGVEIISIPQHNLP